MGLFSVLAQGFPVIAGEDDDRIVAPAPAFDGGEELLQGGVDIGDLTVVEPAVVFGKKRLRRLVGFMRIVAVDPGVRARSGPGPRAIGGRR